MRADRKRKLGTMKRHWGAIETTIDPEGEDVFQGLHEFNNFIEQRIGRTPREYLAWAVRAVQHRPGDMTPGDWDNLRTELVGFVTNRIADQFGSSVAMWSEGKGLDRPNQEEAKAMLERMGMMIEAAIKRQPIPVAKVNGTLVLRLFRIQYAGTVPEWSRFWEGVRFNWSDRAALALGDLIETKGTLLKECPAPLPRDQEICGTWFVATRPRQEYCSGTCQSRASTRAARAGTETPAAQRRKTEKEG